MDIEEKIEQEVIKNMFKLAVYRNNKLSQEQKQFAMNRIDAAACQADWIIQILKECGYLR